MLSFSPDGTALACEGSKHSVHLRDAATGEIRKILSGHSEPVDGLAFSSDGWMLAAISVCGRDFGAFVAPLPGGLPGGHTRGTIAVWDVETGQLLSFFWTLSGLTAVAFRPGHHTLATATADGTVALRDVRGGARTMIHAGDGPGACTVAFSPDGQVLAFGGRDGVTRLVDLDDVRTQTKLGGGRGPITALAFSPDGKLLAASTATSQITLWDRAVQQERITLALETASSQRPADFRPRFEQPPIGHLAFSPDSKALVVAGPKTVTLWVGAADDPPPMDHP